ncbi:RimJ/RimL family protein N-acetyltransferase [Sinobacterium caligoides]|uniref:RimJ/RimL family protein N-acetyltransferase n=1 Tax=Sinobacterium caligoides TaxID=933926 RepID=A0A3N2D553_9GAMM|nr:GNAT family protein [Sinobacterium caligoides]ROR94901.1 RimJ/RimL family protein N-acetyltransferase [Sinobacterium caligoides]
MKFDTVHLETERVLIRLVKESDSRSLYKIYSDPKAMEYWSSIPFENESQATELVKSAINNFDSGSSLLLAIILKESGELVGTLNLFNVYAESKRAEVGYILSSLFWRKGLMAESFGALIHFCFEHLKLNRLEADIDPDNVASSALLKKHGFKVEGLLKERWIVNGNITDSEVYGLVKSSYNKQLNTDSAYGLTFCKNTQNNVSANLTG